MGGKFKMKKKGTTGMRVAYYTRSHSLKKLGISLREFRKLCILKGVFPREPRKKRKGSDKTYYLAKDILFMAADPLIPKFREMHTWRAKVKKAKMKGLRDKLLKLRKHRPDYTLDHIVRERYPEFMDALKDLDDALCMIHLFGGMRSHGKSVGYRPLLRAKHLSREFQAFVAITHSLRKVFVSIKGIYYQAVINNVPLTWLVPHRFTPEDSGDVDLKVMMSFLEWHLTQVGFVNCHLYRSIGLTYPPKLQLQDNDLAGYISPILLNYINLPQNNDDDDDNDKKTKIKKNKKKNKAEKKPQPPVLPKKIEEQQKERINSLGEKLANLKEREETNEAHSTDLNQEKQQEQEQAQDEDELTPSKLAEIKKVFNDFEQQEDPDTERLKSLFKNCYFFLSREIPILSLEFVILSFQGNVSWEGKYHGYERDDKRITHEVVDRGADWFRKWNGKVPGRTYVQPQWIYDSVNAGFPLPTSEYHPEVSSLPPHLSPFVDHSQSLYEHPLELPPSQVPSAQGLALDHNAPYVPDRWLVIRQYKEAYLKSIRPTGATSTPGTVPSSSSSSLPLPLSSNNDDEDEDLEIEDLEEQYNQELEAEAAGALSNRTSHEQSQPVDDQDESDDSDEDSDNKKKTTTTKASPTPTPTPTATAVAPIKKKTLEERKRERKDEMLRQMQRFREMMITSKKKKKLFHRIKFSASRRRSQQRDLLLKREAALKMAAQQGTTTTPSTDDYDREMMSQLKQATNIIRSVGKSSRKRKRRTLRVQPK